MAGRKKNTQKQVNGTIVDLTNGFRS